MRNPSDPMKPAPPDAASDAVALHQVDPRVVLSSIGEAVYDWDIASDTLSWSGNAMSLFGVSDVDRLVRGEAFNKLMDPISPTTRAEAILLCDGKDLGSGVPYRLSFAIQHGRDKLIWFEDTGRWFAGSDGRAAAAHGVVRRVDGPGDAERHEIASAKIDELTGGFLRAPFIRLMSDDLEKLKLSGKNAVFLMVGIDDLAFIGQSYGLEAVDELIAGVARRLRTAIRRKDRLVRYSNSKLGVWLTVFSGTNVAEAAERLMGAVASQPVRTSKGPIAARLHVGSVMAPKDGAEPILLLRRAEEALNDARASQRTDFVAYSADDTREEARRTNLSASEDVVRALNERRVVVALEPVLSAGTRIVQFHEVLVRVIAQNGAELGAGAIIPVAERFGLVKFVDIRVLELAVAILARDPDRRLSVNVSMRTAVTQDWLAALTGHVVKHPGIADRLIIEITETAAMADLDATAAIVRQIKQLGVRVAIDDFGSGHTSFRSLRALPVDILKIDGVFVQNLARSVDDQFFVRTLVDLARHLGVQTVAEWVQDEESARMLADWGVTFLQGEFCGLAKVHEVREQAEAIAVAS